MRTGLRLVFMPLTVGGMELQVKNSALNIGGRRLRASVGEIADTHGESVHKTVSRGVMRIWSGIWECQPN